MAGDSKGQQSWWVVVLLSAFGMYALGPAVSEPKDSEKKAVPQISAAARPAVDAKAKVESDYECLRPIYEHLGKSLCLPNKLSDADLFPGEATYEFVIATVADPVDTRLGYLFDQSVDAICAAMQASGEFRFDRFWLPWPERHRGGGTASAANSAPLEARKFERLPGVLLFRRATQGKSTFAQGHNKPHLMVVFLVGETPTGGIHQRAFTHSLNLLGQCRAVAGIRKKVRLLGPAFSGSTDSLAIAIRNARSTEFEIISGSATGADRKQLENCRPNGGVTFCSTMLNDRYVVDRLLTYLKEELKCDGNIALLTESNTAYGSEIATEWRNLQNRNVVNLRFPLHIASLRPAYDAERAKRGQAAAKIDPYAARVHIPFDSEDQTHDVVPSLDPAMSMVSDDQIVSQILATLTSDDIRAVGLFATDVRDKIFLATLIRQRCPSVTLFTTDADLLLASREHRNALAGTICASTYPLYPRVQEWTFAFRGEKHRVSFPSELGYGTYNAALALLGHDNYMLEYGSPRANFKLEDRLPSVWFGVVGGNGIWPLTCYQHTCDPCRSGPYSTLAGEFKGYTYLRRQFPHHQFEECDCAECVAERRRSAEELRRKAECCGKDVRVMLEPPPKALLGYSSLAYVFSATVAALCLYVIWRLPQYFIDPTSALPTGMLANEVKFRRLLWGALCCVPVAFVALHYAQLWFTPLGPHAETVAWHYYLALALTVTFVTLFILTLATAAALSIVSCRRLPDGSSDLPDWMKGWDGARERGYLLFGCALLGLFIVMVSAPRLRPLTTPELLAFERAMRFESGLSPLFPVALFGAGLFGWGRSQLLVTQQFVQFLIPSPFPDDSPGADADKEIWKAVLRPWQGKSIRYLLIWLSLTPVVLLVCWRARLATYDGPGFTAGFLVAYYFLIALTLAALLHTLSVGSALFKLAGAIGIDPLSPAFNRLPNSFVQAYGQYYSAKRPGLAQFGLPVEQWTRVMAIKGANTRLRGLLGANELEQVYQTDRKSCVLAATPRELAKLTAECITRLSASYWPQLTLQQKYPALDDKEDVAPETVGSAELWRAVEDFVAINIVLYLHQFLLYLRHQVFTLSVVPLLMLFGVTIYQFQPHHLLMMVANLLIVAAAAVVMSLIVRINLDSVFSYISRTHPFHLSMDRTFIVSAITYALPLAVLVLTQFDEVSNWLFSWLEGF